MKDSKRTPQRPVERKSPRRHNRSNNRGTVRQNVRTTEPKWAVMVNGNGDVVPGCIVRNGGKGVRARMRRTAKGWVNCK